MFLLTRPQYKRYSYVNTEETAEQILFWTEVCRRYCRRVSNLITECVCVSLRGRSFLSTPLVRVSKNIPQNKEILESKKWRQPANLCRIIIRMELPFVCAYFSVWKAFCSRIPGLVCEGCQGVCDSVCAFDLGFGIGFYLFCRHVYPRRGDGFRFCSRL